MSRISIDRSVVEQALEALEKTHTQPGCEQWRYERKASIALRAVLAEYDGTATGKGGAA